MRPLYLFLAFLLIEIAAFAAIGGEIGVFGTLGIVIGSTALGVYFLRKQGFEAAQALRMGVMPTDAAGQVAQRTLGAFAAFLLIIPGFVTSAIGAVLLIPAVRDFLWRKVEGKIQFTQSGFGTTTHDPRHEGVYDAEFEDITGAPETAKRLPRDESGSGWTKSD